MLKKEWVFNMNKYVKMFLKRGIAFGGLGPVVAAIIYVFVGYATKDNLITTNQYFLSIISTYILAFTVAGCSMLYNIEHWSFLKASLIHFTLLYLSYLLVYIANGWFPFTWIGFTVFTLIFIIGYLIIWLSIYLSIKAQAKKLNDKISK